MFFSLLVMMRPKQWTKNILLFAGLVFSVNLTNRSMLLTTVAAFVLFCLLSSAVYLVNDVADIEKDRNHPIKRRRPLPSGRLKPIHASMAAILLLVVALPSAFLLKASFGWLAAAYFALMLAYSFGLKQLVIIDVLTIAAGFLLRAVAGAAVIGVPISPWLYVCTILGALFLGLAKRRHELVLLGENAINHREILREYSADLLDQMISIVTSSTVMAYSLYTFSAENLPANHAMMLTIPFVLYGIFRYLYLVHQKEGGGSPEEALLEDIPLLVDIALWVASAGAILYLS